MENAPLLPTYSNPPNPQFYSQRPDWADVTPVEQSDLANPLVPIFYPSDYKDATDYFRGVMATGERSERVMELTEHIIRMNPAHYTVWQYRYDTLIALGAPLEKELELMDEISKKFIKYYQIWHHRRLLQTILCKPLPELTFIAKILAIDEKNYHTWAYRQWILVHFNQPELWDGELPFIELLLSGDVRNNSAWHHRFFVVFETGAHSGSLEDEEGGGRDEVLRRELRFVKEKISLAPGNASAWNYLRGVCEKSNITSGELKEFVELYTVPHQKAGGLDGEDYVDLENPKPSKGARLPCSLAIEFLADIYVEEGDKARAAELFRSLAKEHDVTRKKYWEHRARGVTPISQQTSAESHAMP